MKKRIDEQLQKYKQRQQDLPQLKKKLERTKRKLEATEKQVREMEDGKQKRYKEDEIAEERQHMSMLRKSVAQIEQEVQEVEKGTMDYWLNTAPFLLEAEKQQQVEERAIQEMNQTRHESNITSSSLLQYLERLPMAESPGKREDSNLLDVLQPGLVQSEIMCRPVTREREVLAHYLATVEGDDDKLKELRKRRMERTRECCQRPECRGELADSDVGDSMYCLRCGAMEKFLAEEDLGTFNEPTIPMQAPFTYKKKNHFRDWLARIQGKENTVIPTEVYDSLLNELHKLRIKSTDNVDRKLIRSLLKKLKMSKYYRNISQIHYHITGKEPPRFTPVQESVLMDMFMQLEPVYEELKPAGRDNFFSYEYCLNKFCGVQVLLTGDETWGENIKYFKLLRGANKLYESDQVWKKCCKRLKWPFIKSD